MATQSLGDSRLVGVFRLGALVLSLALGVLGAMLLLSTLCPAAVVSAPDEDNGPVGLVSVVSVPKASTGTTPTLHITKTVDPTHLDTGGVVTMCFTIWRPGLDVVLLHDVSGSMDDPAGEGVTPTSRLVASQVVARAFVRSLQRADRSAVVPFSTHAHISQVQPLTTIVTNVLETIDGLSARGWTNMGEGISASRGQLMTGPGRVSGTVKAIVILSDGYANCDENGCDEDRTEEGAEYALQKAADAAKDNIKIYTVGLGAREAVNRSLLETIAMTTGGEYYFPLDPASLEAAYLTMALELHDLVITDVLTPGVKAHCPAGAPYSCSQGADGKKMTVTWPVSDAALITNPLTLCFTATVNLNPGYTGLINDPQSHFCYEDSLGNPYCLPLTNPTITVTGFSTVCVEGKVFYDANANGQDDGEDGLAGATIAATSGPSTVTGSSGTFSLCVPVSGAPITITEIDPEGFTSTAAIAGDGVCVVDPNTLRIDEPEVGRKYGENKFGDVGWLVYFPVTMREYAPPSLHLSTKTVDKWKACAGEILRYTITLTNSGTVEPISAVVTDPIPVDCTYVPGSVTGGGRFEDGQIRWGPDTLGPKAKHDIAFEVEIDGDVCNAVITNTTTVLEIRDGRSNLLPPLTATTRVPVINGGFEEGWIGWGHGGELSQTLVLTDRLLGRFSALLGSPDYPCRYVPVGSAWVEQTICVPSTVSPTLSFWYEIWTYDRNRKLSRAYDLFDVKVDGVQVFSDMNQTEPYGCRDPVTVVAGVGTIDLSAYRGRRVVIRFENWNRPDRPYNTWTYVDDVRIDR